MALTRRTPLGGKVWARLRAAEMPPGAPRPPAGLWGVCVMNVGPAKQPGAPSTVRSDR